ncbi:hypothetical protein IF2G_01433 [Cordyceps javanica]|nr:hypothetical protein IF2G_01433 [Cordyceps javanica]
MQDVPISKYASHRGGGGMRNLRICRPHNWYTKNAKIIHGQFGLRSRYRAHLRLHPRSYLAAQYGVLEVY